MRPDLIDPTLGAVLLKKYVSFGNITLAHCTSKLTGGGYLAPAPVSVAIHEGASIDMEWREPGSDRVRRGKVSSGTAHIIDGETPLWARCSTSNFFAFAFDKTFLEGISERALDGRADFQIQSALAVEDPIIAHLGAVGRAELREGGMGGRLYAEGLAATLAVHLLRKYASPQKSQISHKGGLAPWQKQRVLDYIEEHFTSELGLVELAAVANLSPNYFVHTFKKSIGTTPHRFLMERRVQHALDLLRDEERSIVEIARATGFSSPSHLATVFRRVTGLTPAQVRRSLG
jgi:AraC family transcriptional regulator